ncbi:MAG: hypothetical protein C4332_09545 [Meiothermus sp.]
MAKNCYHEPVSQTEEKNRVGSELREVEVLKLEVYERSYSDRGFWAKLARFARVAGREVVEKALWLYYTLIRPETPASAKRVILGALAYFILPFDLIPDAILGVGFTDDLSVLLLAVGTVARYITPEVKEQARHKAEEWFGPREQAAA